MRFRGQDIYRVTKVVGDTDFVDFKIRVAFGIKSPAPPAWRKSHFQVNYRVTLVDIYKLLIQGLYKN